MKLIHNPRCSKSRQALGLLNDAKIDLKVAEYLKIPLTKDELSEIIRLLEIKPIELIRKGEADYKENFKGKELSDNDWIEAMLEFPKLIERPIFINGNKAVVGRRREKVLEII